MKICIEFNLPDEETDFKIFSLSHELHEFYADLSKYYKDLMFGNSLEDFNHKHKLFWEYFAQRCEELSSKMP